MIDDAAGTRRSCRSSRGGSSTSDGTARWVLAHDRTGEVLVDGVRMPHTRETDGLPVAEDEA